MMRSWRLARATQKIAAPAALKPASVRAGIRRSWRARPGQAGAQGQHNDPARQRAGQPWQHVQDKVDDQAPKRQTDHQPLRQRQPIVGLPECHPRHDITNGRQRQELRRQQQEPGDDCWIYCHTSEMPCGVVPKACWAKSMSRRMRTARPWWLGPDRGCPRVWLISGVRYRL